MQAPYHPSAYGATNPRPSGTAAPWVRRLFERRGLHPDERRLFWSGLHLERFLRWCRKREEGWLSVEG